MPTPNDAVAYNQAGMVQANNGLFEKAVASFHLAVTADPAFAIAHNNLGAALLEVGERDQAIASFARALEIAPQYTEAHHNLGVAHQRAGRHDKAIASLNRAIELTPNYPDAYNNLGITYAELARPKMALACYRRALELNPKLAQVWNNLGVIEQGLGHHELAISGYLSAIQLDAGYAEAYYNLGLALLALHNPGEAIEPFRRAVEIKPRFGDAHANLGVALAALHRFDEAIESYSRALEINPNNAQARAHRMHLLARNCDWSALQTDLALVPTIGVSGGVVPPFSLLSFDDQPLRNRARSERFAAARFTASSTPQPRPLVRPSRLRIGYFSADYSAHAVMFLAARLFETHDRTQFRIHAYSYGPPSADPMRQRVERAFDTFRDVRTFSDEVIAQTARDDGLDIAIDLQGYTARNRVGIFAFRPAPIQMSFLGFPGTSGAPFIDYLIADKIVVPDAHRNAYSENLIYLPHSYQPNDDLRAISQQKLSRLEAQLPVHGFVFCCFNNAYKINPAEFDIWMEVMKKVEGSVLWLLATSDQAQVNLRSEASKRGVDPNRLVFASKMPPPEHLARHQLADLFVDTFNYNAHTTASDALWAGLPVVTKIGEGFAGRVAASLLNAIGLRELITTTAGDYAALLVELATDPMRLRAIRRKLQKNRKTMPLFNSGMFTQHIEVAYQRAYDQFVGGDKLRDIVVEDHQSG